MSTALFWVAHSFDWPTLLSTLLSNELFWGLFLVIYSWEQFFEPSLERWNSFEHLFEHSQECTYSQEHFFEWIYSHECSFEHFLEGSRSTRTYLVPTLAVGRKSISTSKLRIRILWVCWCGGAWASATIWLMTGCSEKGELVVTATWHGAELHGLTQCQ